MGEEVKEKGMVAAMQIRRLNGTALKIIALIAMTVDHVGLILLDGFLPFRIVGRLAFPIFAYMIAEGCRHTRSRTRYFLTVFGTGALCQIGLYIATRSLHMNVLLTFSLSILLIYALDFARRKPRLGAILSLGTLILIFLLSYILPELLPHTDFAFDYRFTGILLAPLIYLGPTRLWRLGLCAVGLIPLCLQIGGIQWASALALIPLALYNEKPGKYRLKALFYLYYPLHLAVIYGIAELMR